MAVWVLIIFWVVAGLGVLLVAMQATRRRRRAGERESKGTRRAIAVGFAVFFVVFGLGLPAWSLITESKAEDEVRGGVDLTNAQVEGRQLFTQNCATCHTLAASNAVGRVGPDLDVMRPTEELTLNAIEEGRARGQGQMPADLVTGQEAQDVASYVAAVAGR
jgi:mono/diheme cytochrome c family protein